MSTEFLDVGPAPASRRARWVRLVVLAVLAALIVSGFVAERVLRDRAERAVVRCTERANSAIDLAGREVRAAYAYVRPSLIDPTPELQAGVARLFAGVAQGANAPLAAPRQRCAEVWILPVMHEDLQAQRDSCVALLEAHEAGLAAVAREGRMLGDWLDVPLSC